MFTISVANQKGGVGKTTTAVNLAVGLRHLGYDVLLVDLDAQGHVAVALGIEVGDEDPTVLDLLRGDRSPEEVVRVFHEGPGRLEIWPAAIDLAVLDREYAGKPSGYHLLSEALEPVKDRYDFTIIDCPRFLGLATSNALVASDAYLVPVVPGILSLDGIKLLHESAAEIKKYLNPRLECLGILLTRADIRTRLTKETMEVLENAYEDLFMDVVIHEWIRYANAVSDGVPIAMTDDEPYMKFTMEVLERVKAQSAHPRS